MHHTDLPSALTGQTVTGDPSKASGHAADFAAVHDDIILSVDDTARLLGLSKSTLAKWCMRGAGPMHVRLGTKSVGYQMGTLRAWLASCARCSTLDGRKAAMTTNVDPVAASS